MGAFIMLVIIGLAIIWILLSKHFEQIGRFFSGMSPETKIKKKVRSTMSKKKISILLTTIQTAGYIIMQPSRKKIMKKERKQ